MTTSRNTSNLGEANNKSNNDVGNKSDDLVNASNNTKDLGDTGNKSNNLRDDGNNTAIVNNSYSSSSSGEEDYDSNHAPSDF